MPPRPLALWRKILVVVILIIGAVLFAAWGGVLFGDPCHLPPYC